MVKSNDLMVQGKQFYAIWDQEKGLWSTNEFDVQRIVDTDIRAYTEKIRGERVLPVYAQTLEDFSTGLWEQYKRYLSGIGSNYHQLDSKIVFANTEVKKRDYCSKRLPYPLEEGPFHAYEELMSTLYDPEEREKLEWAVGAIIAGDAKSIQKFIVMYGEAGSGKSTFLNIVQALFEGYYTIFDAKELTSNNSSFATEMFKTNPLVAIQHDGDLSRIEDNTRLNSIVSHEEIIVNEKFKSKYSLRCNAFLFMGTNRPVRITEAKSGVIRRLIDVHPSGRRVPSRRYDTLVGQIQFELGAIASHCLEVYRTLGKTFFNSYRPVDMLEQTNVFYNFVEDSYDFFMDEKDGISLKKAYARYKEYQQDASLEFTMPMHKFREELKNYFDTFHKSKYVDGHQLRSYYEGFRGYLITGGKPVSETNRPYTFVLSDTTSTLDNILADCKAQYANKEETPSFKWTNVKTKLKDLDTKKLHYVQPPENHIVIDFDLRDSEGKKSFQLNAEAASKWPCTYAEVSKGGNGIHLHYIYDGDVTKLSALYSEGIEIKVFTGNSSLRRKLSVCNNQPIAHLNSGLPLKGEKNVINFDTVYNEKALRTLIKKNLNKEYHGATKPSIDFIYTALEDAYKSGTKFDVTDMRPAILAFAANSTNQASYCIGMVSRMHFCSDEPTENAESEKYADEHLVFFDVEVFPNLFLVNWKFEGTDQCVHMINPTSKEIEELMRYKLVGFNCRRYDNHILYGRYIGYSEEELYRLSQRIIGKSANSFFGEAYNISYTDVYDFASAGNKKSLKKFEIELGLHHQELGIPWDEPVPEEKWTLVSEYCDNDVISTEAVFHHLKGDWAARQILAKLSGLSVNDTTNDHTKRIIFGINKQPQNEFCYRDLGKPITSLDPAVKSYLRENTSLPLKFKSWNGEESILPFFPGYKFENGKSIYRGVETGEGGFVYAETGAYTDVALLDVASMHPSSIEDECLFGPRYTGVYSGIKKGRIAFKHDDESAIETLLNGLLKPFYAEAKAGGTFTPDDVATALKTALNSVYGLTSASFDNQFRDRRNRDNIVAKRGALFMVDLMYEVKKRGFTVAHIKTDSIKIPNATPEIIDFVMQFGKEYGYTFEHEATYDRMCLVNNAVYIARYADADHCAELYGYVPDKNAKKGGKWDATGAQFAHPYVFKTLFSKEGVEFADYCEAKSTKTVFYLDLNEGLGEDEHNYQFVGRVGNFVSVKEGAGGGLLVWKKDEDKYNAASGTKGWRWLEAEYVTANGLTDKVDDSYARHLVDEAKKDIGVFVDFEQFVNVDEKLDLTPPWETADNANVEVPF